MSTWTARSGTPAITKRLANVVPEIVPAEVINLGLHDCVLKPMPPVSLARSLVTGANVPYAVSALAESVMIPRLRSMSCQRSRYCSPLLIPV